LRESTASVSRNFRQLPRNFLATKQQLDLTYGSGILLLNHWGFILPTAVAHSSSTCQTNRPIQVHTNREKTKNKQHDVRDV
jgi:hypothetical protein